MGELAYSNQDGTGKIQLSPTGSVSYQYLNRYVILPVLLRFSPGRPPFFLEAGSQATWLLSQDGSSLVTRHRVGLGLVVGVGYRLGKHLTAGVRLARDAISRTKPEVINFTDQNGTRTQSVTIARNYNQVFSASLRRA